MLNRILVNVNNEKEAEYLSRYAKVIKEKYPDAEVTGLFIKSDIEKSALKDIINTDDIHQLKEEKKNYEEEVNAEKTHEEIVEQKFLSLFGEGRFYTRSGCVSEVLLDEMILFDLLIIAKPNQASLSIENILKDHNKLDDVSELLLFGEKNIKEILSKDHKPMIIVPEQESYSIDNILVADDQKSEVNKALFNFTYLFNQTKNFTAVSVNVKKEKVKDLNIYFEKTGKKINYIFEEGSPDEVIIKYSKEKDLIIMGNLKHSFMFEKIIGKPGIRIIESADKPIFIL